MAAIITTSSSVLPKNVNSSISTSTWTSSNTGEIIKELSLEQVQEAAARLSTYIQKVNNCGNCYTYTIKSTSCQSITNVTSCQSYTCQSLSCQSYTCQSCQRRTYSLLDYSSNCGYCDM